MAWERWHLTVRADQERIKRVKSIVQWFLSPGNGLAEVYLIYEGPDALVLDISAVGRAHDAHRAMHCIMDAIRDRTRNDPEIQLQGHIQ